MLRKDFSLEIKAVTEAGEVEGYGSTFGGKPDSYGDVVERGAFAATIAGHKRAGTMPMMLWGHQSGDLPIGDWVDMAEDAKGLWLKGQIDLDDPMGARVHAKLKRKSLRGLSIGYDTIEKRTDEKTPGVRFLTKLDLWEVSVVNFPANRRAFVTGVKDIVGGGETPPLDLFDEVLREAGFSKTQRTVIAGKGYLHLLRGEPGSATGADFLSALNAGLTR